VINTEYPDFAAMRAELMRDYAPQNAMERLLVYEVAASWRRLEEVRYREHLFFDLQKHREARSCDERPKGMSQDGVEVLMWLDDSHPGYNQVMRAIRDAGIAFDRAVHRLEQVVGARRRREVQAAKEDAIREQRALKLVMLRQRAANSLRNGNLVELAPPATPRVRSKSRVRAPDEDEQSA
jgi:hypothetical protein